MRKAGEVVVRKRPSGKWEYRFEIEPLDGKRRRKEKGGFLRQICFSNRKAVEMHKKEKSYL